jgi:4-hydroxy-2-oxoheptanedioate aldolase
VGAAGQYGRCGRIFLEGPVADDAGRRDSWEADVVMAISEADVRRRWADGQPCHGLWSLLPGVVTAEVLARTGADFVVVDLQHGAVTEADLPGVAAAIRAAGPVPLVRTRSPVFSDVGRPLDLGACGVIVPNVRDAEHARQVVAASRYAPAGDRSIGRLSGGSDEPLVIVMVETATALDDLDAVLSVEGLDGIYVGPGDLSLSLGLDGANRTAELRGVLSSIIARAAAAGVPVGVHAYSGQDAGSYAAEGATIVTAGVDTVSLSAVEVVRHDGARGWSGADQA